MKLLPVQQGSAQWHAARAKHFCASEAAAMMGVSPYTSRTELLRQKAGGETPDVDPVKQAIFDRGHAAEAAARIVIEQIMGEDLFPATGAEGQLLASFDGITIDGDTGFEHKLWNEELAALVRAGEVPPSHYWQLEHQILVGSLKRVYFVVSDGTEEKIEWLEYKAVPGRAEQLKAGWKQFAEDLANYQPQEYIPAPTPAPVKDLPAIIYKLDGLSLTSNLAEFKSAAELLVADSKKALETDQDFADREKLCKAFGETEAKLKVIKEQVVGEIKDVDAFCRDLGEIGELIRQARLNGEKQVAARKDAIRLDILNGGKKALSEHVIALNTRLGRPYMPLIQADFAGAMKGKKTLASLRDAVDTELARAKIEANATADRIEINLNTLRDLAKDHAFLFADAATIVLKANDDLTMAVKVRIAEHKVAEDKRLDAERERIRAEEVAKAQPAVQATAPAAVPPRPNVVPIKATRPTDDQIIGALALRYGVNQQTVIGWLVTMDLPAATLRLDSKELA